MTDRDRFRGCLLGLACGDAVGTTVEFCSRGTFPPVTDMVGGGVFRLPPGAWTDDTSMALCLAASLTECGRFDAHDQMQRYCQWVDEGYFSSTGHCFDIGNTVSAALRRFQHTGDPWSGSTDPRSAGNGSIMRLAPVPMFFYPDWSQTLQMGADSSRTTHGTAECLEACRLLAGMVFHALAGASKQRILFDHGVSELTCEKILGIARGDYRTKDEEEISGSGYVVHSLEAALWCFRRARGFEDAILQATNLGQDADTTAAICGQLAGAYYGESGIPSHWLEQLVMVDTIRALSDRLAEATPKPNQKLGGFWFE